MRNPHERSYEDDGDEAEEDVTKALYPRRPAALRRAFPFGSECQFMSMGDFNRTWR
jgi:hypothetical protein